MKKHFKQVLSTVLVFIMALLCSINVQAQTITRPNQVITLYSSDSLSYNANKRAYSSANEIVLNTDIYMNRGVTSYKSSDTSVVELVSRKLYPLTQWNPKPYMAYFMKAQKTGKTVISYKAGNNTYKQNVIVKKYENPLSTLKLGSLNLTSRFKTNASYTLSYEKYKNKNLKLQMRLKSGWILSGACYIDTPKTYTRGTWIANGKTFKITKKNSALCVYVFNQKTRQSEECLIIFK